MGKRVLIVDDNPDIREILKEFFRLSDWQEIVTAENGLQAITLVADQEFNLVVTDWCMPEMDGLELCSWISVNRKDIPIVFMTGHSVIHAQQKLAGMSVSVKKFLAKPFSLEDLDEIIQVQ